MVFRGGTIIILKKTVPVGKPFSSLSNFHIKYIKGTLPNGFN